MFRREACDRTFRNGALGDGGLVFPESSAKGHRYFLSEDQCRQSRAVFSIFSLLKARAPSDLSLSVRSGRARNLWTATKQVLKARIWTRISESNIAFYGDSENRSPEADFGLPKIENSTFHLFAKIFAQTVFPSGSVCENCPGDFCARIAQGGF